MSTSPPVRAQSTLQSTLPASARNDISPAQVTQQQLHNYFALKPSIRFAWWVTALIVLSVCALCGGLGSFASAGTSSVNAGAGVTGFFLLAFAVGVAVAAGFGAYNPVRQYNSRDTITDAAFDRWVDWQQQESMRRGCDRLGLDFNRLNLRPPDPNAQIARDPITIRGFERARYLIPVGGSNGFIVAEARIGNDGFIRWRRNVYIWFFPKDRKLAAYKRTLDAVLPNESVDSTQEYFYQAVSGITTSQERLERLDRVGLGSMVTISATEFTLRIENGDKISTPVTPIEAHLRMRDSGMEGAVRSLRDLLDETKYAQLGGAGQAYPSGYGAPPPGFAPAGGYPSGGYNPGGYPSGGYAPPPPPGYMPGAPTGAYPSGGYAPPPPGYAPPGYAPPGYAPGQPAPYPAESSPTTPYPPASPSTGGYPPPPADTTNPGATPPTDPAPGQ